MGMAQIIREQDLEGLEKNKEFKLFIKNEKITHRVTDFLIGFFAVPFSWFTITTSTAIFSAPNKISDGRAILFLGLLSGIYLILSKQTIFILEKEEKYLFKILGILTFIIFLCFNTVNNIT